MTTRFSSRRRRWFTAAAAAVACVATVLTSGAAQAAPAKQAKAAKACAPVMFVVPGWQDGGAEKLLNRSFSPQGADPVRIPYPNAITDINLYHNVDVGVANLRKALYDLYVTHGCGLDTKVYIAGFSLGALVAGTVLETEPAGRNIQGILFADGRRQPVDSNVQGDPGGLVGHLPVPGPGGAGFRAHDAFKYPTLSLCNGPNSPGGADLICYGGTNLDSYFASHPFYTFEVARELNAHGEGPYPNNLRNRVIP
ncbi:hypothetical protein SAMN05421630_11287 [Prauserella marina]|uniref:Uncharacterized protein n=1 Tax=Prauserella marina TaxID=530584 RepID=A0A1G6XGL4_9PSEU|nr:hypothetical protein [Prauserella marina]PWV72552.1 hypothetical protein DES30_110151 [Prauserella marina]SDD77358.1 hypothetical protein SAMN05421630_11287 [Prauserella marina]